MMDERARTARSGRDKEFGRPASRTTQERSLKSANAGRSVATALGIAALAFSSSAHASFLPPEVMDSVAMGVAWFVIVVIPIGAIILFWMVHVLPEKIAHKRHHPQRDAIHTLCLLSLAFGGLLWPLAWLWAYVKPVGYRSAYGTDKHDDYFHAMGTRAKSGELLDYELLHLREELDNMAEKGTLSAELKVLRKDLASAQAARADSVDGPGVQRGTNAQKGAV